MYEEVAMIKVAYSLLAISIIFILFVFRFEKLSLDKTNKKRRLVLYYLLRLCGTKKGESIENYDYNAIFTFRNCWILLHFI